MDESPPPSRISAAELDRFTLDLVSLVCLPFTAALFIAPDPDVIGRRTPPIEELLRPVAGFSSSILSLDAERARVVAKDVGPDAPVRPPRDASDVPGRILAEATDTPWPPGVRCTVAGRVHGRDPRVPAPLNSPFSAFCFAGSREFIRTLA